MEKRLYCCYKERLKTSTSNKSLRKDEIKNKMKTYQMSLFHNAFLYCHPHLKIVKY